jgi:hypothetical protein
MNKKLGAKIKAAKDAAKARRLSQTIAVDENWRIVRADALNWEIQYKGESKGYYGQLENALKALPAKLLHETAKNSLAEIQRSLEAIREAVVKAIQTAHEK